MTKERFKDVREQLNAACEKLLGQKGKEYTRGQDDRLANFKGIAEQMNTTPLLVWYIFFYKHIDAIAYYISHEDIALSESIDSRIMDARNYLDLLYALLHEETAEEPCLDSQSKK